MTIGPEEITQRGIAAYLDQAMPPDYLWTAIEAAGRGGRDGKRQQLKGVKPGWMDLQFLLPPFGTYLGIEVKSKTGSPSPSQKENGERIVAVGGYWFPAKTCGDVEYVLRAFGVPLRARSLEKPRPHLVRLIEQHELSRFQVLGRCV